MAELLRVTRHEHAASLIVCMAGTEISGCRRQLREHHARQRPARWKPRAEPATVTKSEQTCLGGGLPARHIAE